MASFLSSRHGGGRSNTFPSPLAASPNTSSSMSNPKLSLSTRNLRSGSSLSHHADNRSPSSPNEASLRRDNMPSASSPLPPPDKKPSTTSNSKLHKRRGSGTLPTQFATPYATYEEPFPDIAVLPPPSSTPKIKPYLRKMSSSKEDQGAIDLSKSLTEYNQRLAGLGIQDFATRSASDVNFAHAGRRQAHARTISGGSQVSSASGSTYNRQPQTFTHPMTKAPRPYTPPMGPSYASSLNDEANESDDIVDDDFRHPPAFRSKRSVSISSTPQANPTPLSQSHTASDLAYFPPVLANASQTNLSIKSSYSNKSKKGRPRRDTDRSDMTTPSSRTSFDRAFSLVGRKSETEPQSREELILEARRKFEEKEANKERKRQKRRESEESKKSRKQSDPTQPQRQSPLKNILAQSTAGGQKKQQTRGKSSAGTAIAGATDDEKVVGRSYEAYRPANAATLPRHGVAPGERNGEKTGHAVVREREAAKSDTGGWMRFSTWMQTRMLSCGGSRQ